MNSGGLKISISSRMYNLSMYFKSILILANVSDSIEVFLQGGYKLYVGSLKNAWRLTRSSGADNCACRSSKKVWVVLKRNAC